MSVQKPFPVLNQTELARPALYWEPMTVWRLRDPRQHTHLGLTSAADSEWMPGDPEASQATTDRGDAGGTAPPNPPTIPLHIIETASPDFFFCMFAPLYCLFVLTVATSDSSNVAVITNFIT